MNNSGKTSLLEAVYLLANQNDPARLGEILENRGELGLPRSSNVRSTYQISQLFNGRQFASKDAIRISSQHDRPLSFQITIQLTTQPDERSSAKQMPIFEESDEGTEPLPLLELLFDYGAETVMKAPLRDDGSLDSRAFRLFSRETHPSQFLTTNNLDYSDLADLWDSVHLTAEEDKVVAALQTLDPRVERIGFTSRQTTNSGIRLKLQGQQDPVPLGSMGDGMRRILTLTTAEIASEDGVLLVDEIDTGLYYRAQKDMWHLLIQTARRLNVQVFATTHSLDCVRAFQEALSVEEDKEIGKLFRLNMRGGNIRPVAYAAHDLEIAMQQEIEVR